MPVKELFVPPFTNTHWHDNGVKDRRRYLLLSFYMKNTINHPSIHILYVGL